MVAKVQRPRLRHGEQALPLVVEPYLPNGVSLREISLGRSSGNRRSVMNNGQTPWEDMVSPKHREILQIQMNLKCWTWIAQGTPDFDAYPLKTQISPTYA